ncbi:MAG: hypothetical protein IKN15_12735 [Bacteroidaceae bacterium]|nr:hypothetical protein [Bacteroidaceae bacterium]
MEQIIENAKLKLISSGGIRPMVQYAGLGRLATDGKGFRFVEKKEGPHTRNVRIAGVKGAGQDSMFYQVNDGRFRMTLYLDADQCTLKAIQEKVKPLLAEAKKGEYL